MPELLRIRADDPEYQAMVRAEADWWATHPSMADLEDAGGDVRVLQHYNRRYTGDPNTRWFETIATYGPFTRGLILGGAGLIREAEILEENPSLHVTFFDISPGVLAKRQAAFHTRFGGRFRTEVADFNFIDLPNDTYDFILSSSVMHHVINLEHVAAQVQRALTPDGYLFLEDYVGESKRNFSPEKKLAYELAYNREMTRQGRQPAQLTWVNEEADASPFCGIRSGDILGVFRQHLAEQEVRTTGALWLAMLYARDPRLAALRGKPRTFRLARRTATRLARLATRRNNEFGTAGAGLIAPEFIDRLLETGDRLSDAGAIVPSNAFAIYRKRPES
jgi:SAM-dependent methyltransferase